MKIAVVAGHLSEVSRVYMYKYIVYIFYMNYVEFRLIVRICVHLIMTIRYSGTYISDDSRHSKWPENLNKISQSLKYLRVSLKIKINCLLL